MLSLAIQPDLQRFFFMPNSSRLCTQLIDTTLQAGRIIMRHYQCGVDVSVKDDMSPVTLADTDAEAIILKALGKIAPEIPVISEEAASQGVIPDVADRFFLVDPLDGTKEFIRHNDEFTVNIALIENAAPVMGIVYAPALARMFFAPSPDKAFELYLPIDAQPQLDQSKRLKVRTPPPQGLTAAVSRSHIDAQTDTFLEQFTIAERRSAGSSLKFCLIASAEIDIYPRTGPTMEWDTAAGHAVLLGAGGSVTIEDGSALTYGKKETRYKNPAFTAWGNVP
jgi:3'(2'), 5'-bisphosphate nucleotidase